MSAPSVGYNPWAIRTFFPIPTTSPSTTITLPTFVSITFDMVPETPKIIELDADLAATSELADRRKKALLVGVSSTTGLHTHEDVNLVYNLLASAHYLH